MTFVKLTTVSFIGLTLAGCADLIEGGNRTGSERFVDAGTDAKPLSELVAGIWVDPDGCDQWIIDDGVEGYLTDRLSPADGRPICSGIAPPSTAIGAFQEGSDIPDSL
jgi:hypothetical protein